MNRQQRDYFRLASKYRRLAGELGFCDVPRIEDTEAKQLVQAAHDNLCKAFSRLEELSEFYGERK